MSHQQQQQQQQQRPPQKPIAAKTFADLDVSDDGKQMRFEVRDMEVGVLNAVRRAAVAHVPSAAFDYHPTVERFPDCGVRVVRNTCPLHNEMLGSRLALVPVCLTENQVEELRAAPSPLTFVLRRKNESLSDMLLVTTADLELEGGEPVVVDGNDGKGGDEGKRDSRRFRAPNGMVVDMDLLFPACRATGDRVLLTKLRPNPHVGAGDEVHLRCAARVGTGDEHARWSPVSVCYFVNKVDPAAADAAFREYAERQARYDPDAARDEVRLRARFDALEARRHFYRDPETGEANRFEFRIESECGQRAPAIVLAAFDALLQRVRAVRRAVETHDVDKVATFVPDTPRRPPTPSSIAAAAADADEGRRRGVGGAATLHRLHHIVIKGEGHTLGNLLQSVIYSRYFPRGYDPVRAASGEAGPLASIGYDQPHPLEDCIVLRVRLAGSDGDNNIEAFLIDNLTHVESRLLKYAREWVDASGLLAARPPVDLASRIMAATR